MDQKISTYLPNIFIKGEHDKWKNKKCQLSVTPMSTFEVKTSVIFQKHSCQLPDEHCHQAAGWSITIKLLDEHSHKAAG